LAFGKKFPYNSCKYKTPNPLKIVVEHHHFFEGFVAHQKMQQLPN
jgi:hypothetical protein